MKTCLMIALPIITIIIPWYFGYFSAMYEFDGCFTEPESEPEEEFSPRFREADLYNGLAE